MESIVFELNLNQNKVITFAFGGFHLFAVLKLAICLNQYVLKTLFETTSPDKSVYVLWEIFEADTDSISYQMLWFITNVLGFFTVPSQRLQAK